MFSWLLDWGSSLPSIGKIVLFLTVWFGIWLPVAVPLAMFLKWKPFQPFTPQQKLPLVAALYVFVPLLVWLNYQIEPKSLSDYGLNWQSSLIFSLLIGMGLGGLGLILVFGLESWGGWIQWNRENWPQLVSNSVPLLAIALWIGITEELIFRGIFQTQLQETYSPAIAAIISSIIFALLHLLWERKETLPQLPGLWLMGMVLVGARWIDGGNLGLAWGLHSAWVWGLASLDAAELIIYPVESPQWITGIYRQPLAGLSGLLCLILTGGILWGFSN
ncbi:MAG: lysostaphin resistance A-like protein [Microcystaceae cyanobacterium]